MRVLLVIACALLAAPLDGCCVPAPSPTTERPTPPPDPQAAPTPGGSAPSGAVSAPSGTAPALSGSASAPPSSRPASLTRADSQLEDRAKRNDIPQVGDRRAEFAALVDAPAGDITGGRLFCDLQMPNTPWFRSRPDMRARFTLGRGATMIADGHDNRDNVTLAVPVATLAAGDSIRVEVHDRDLFNKDDFLDAVDATFPGHLPLIAQGGAKKLQITCRHQGADVVANRFAAASAAGARAMETWRTSLGDALHPARLDLGYPWVTHRAMEDGIDGMAALVGWEEATVATARQDRIASLAAWERQATALVKTLRADALPGKDAVAVDGLGTVGPISVTCGEEAVRALLAGTPVAGEASPPCVVQTVTDADFAASARWEMALVMPEGRTESLSLLTPKAGSAIWQTSALGAPLGGSPIKEAALLRLSDGENATFWRL